jgi:hypothetical protein
MVESCFSEKKIRNLAPYYDGNPEIGPCPYGGGETVDKLSNEDAFRHARSRAASSRNCTYVNDDGVTIDPWRGWYFKPLTVQVTNPWARYVKPDDFGNEPHEGGCLSECLAWPGQVWNSGLSFGRTTVCPGASGGWVEKNAMGCANLAWGFFGKEFLDLPTATAAKYQIVFPDEGAPPGTELDVNWKVVRRENAGSLASASETQEGANTTRTYTKTIELKELMAAPHDEYGSTDFEDPSWDDVIWSIHDQPSFDLSGLARAQYRFVAFSNEPVTFQWTVERENAAGVVTTEYKSATTSGASGVHWTPAQQELTDNVDLSNVRIVNIIASGDLIHDPAGDNGTWVIDWKRRQGVWGHRERTGQEEEYYLERWTTWRQTFKTTGASSPEDQCYGIPLGYTPLDLETIYIEVDSYETGSLKTFVPENGDRFIYTYRSFPTETDPAPEPKVVVYQTGFRSYVPSSREVKLTSTGRPFNSQENEFFVFAIEQDTKTKWVKTESKKLRLSSQVVRAPGIPLFTKRATNASGKNVARFVRSGTDIEAVS